MDLSDYGFIRPADPSVCYEAYDGPIPWQKGIFGKIWFPLSKCITYTITLVRIMKMTTFIMRYRRTYPRNKEERNCKTTCFQFEIIYFTLSILL